MKLFKTKEKEIYYYFLSSGEKRFIYRHKFQDSLGKRREKKKSGFKTEKEALQSLLEIKASILSNGTGHIEHSNMTVSQWLDIWFETKKRTWAITTKTTNAMAIKYLKKYVGKYKLNTLRSSTYERDFINKLLDNNFKSGSVALYHNIFKTAINAAVADEVITKNRFTNIKVEFNGELKNFIKPDELSLLIDYALKYGNKTQYLTILILTYSGMRKGELNGLKWTNIDFVNNTITIERTRDYNGERKPKSKRSYRTIEIDDIVMKKLEKYKTWCAKLKLSYGIQLKEMDLVFIDENNIDGIHIDFANYFLHKLYNYMEADDVKINRITPHGLRHTHATILIDELIPPTDVADRLGNTLEMIYNVYAHSFKKIENKTVIAFSDRLKSAVKI